VREKRALSGEAAGRFGRSGGGFGYGLVTKWERGEGKRGGNVTGSGEKPSEY
jgi:hypothetical protein